MEYNIMCVRREVAGKTSGIKRNSEREKKCDRVNEIQDIRNVTIMEIR